VRQGAGYFTEPTGAAQRRYEALRAYFLDEMPAAEVADRFGYSTASIHQMATLLRKGRLNLFAGTRPGPKGPRKVTGQLRARVLELRTAGHSVAEIAAALTREGMPVSAQTAWLILDAEGLPRLPRRDDGHRGPPARPGPVKAAALPGWPDGPVSLPCDHAGLLLLFPAICDTEWPGEYEVPAAVAARPRRSTARRIEQDFDKSGAAGPASAAGSGLGGPARRTPDQAPG
jgi:transposase